MPDDRQEIEKQLLGDPFNEDLRARYARCLFDAEEYTASLAQWRLLVKQASGKSEPCLEAARCCARLADAAGTEDYLQQARACPDFAADDERAAEIEPAGPERRLRVLAGGKRSQSASGEVVSIASTEKVRFADVVGMQDLKNVLRLRIIEPFVTPGLFKKFKKRSGGGVLLYGPPGCGKTMMARAIATECQAAFTSVGISDILNMWIGESERNLAAIFQKARQDAPAVLFFDELDALAFSRSKAVSDHTRTLVNEFLAQLDGMSGNNDRVLIMAATNMPWDVDDAMKRPGRFDRQIFVPPPDAAARAEMFRLKLIGVPTETLDTDVLGTRSVHFSGADIDGVIDRAKDAVLGDILGSGNERRLRQEDLLAALEHEVPSTLEWLKTARNLVKFGNAGAAYRDVEAYLRSAKLY
jgi:transitional endoplasmic reticulum ATPase